MRRVPSKSPWVASTAGFVLAAVLAGAVVGCAAPPPPPQRLAIGAEAMPFDQAVELATAVLLQDLPTAAAGGLMAKPASGPREVVVLDPTLDAASGQQTLATQRLDRALNERMARPGQKLELVGFDATNLARARYLMTGTLLREKSGFRFQLSLVDVKSGLVTAHTSALMQEAGIDMSPLAYYRDSPVLVKDGVIDGYIQTSAAATGQKADAVYLARIATAAVIHDATELYNEGRYEDALARYRSALAMPAGEELRVLNGVYLSTVKLGQTARAEEAFGRVVGYGISRRQLGVKFLFNPGSTEFWSDPKVSAAYGMWLRQIVRQSASAKVCMNVIGHTSATGSESVNDALSLKRAMFIKQQMGAESREFASRVKTQGMGSRQNIVGSATDDVVDAPDRRVEFAIVDCARG